jgi:hypothetical protein
MGGMYKMLYLENGIVYEKELSENGGILIKNVGIEKNIHLTVDKAIIANGIDKAIITAKLVDWQGQEIKQSVNIQFNCNGQLFDTVTTVNGIATLEFTSMTQGLYIVGCSSINYGAGIVEVVVNEA